MPLITQPGCCGPVHTHTQGMQPRARVVCHGGQGDAAHPAPPVQPTTMTSCGSRSPCGTAWCWSPSAWSTTWPSATVFHLRPTVRRR